jgi:hypothetical protein
MPDCKTYQIKSFDRLREELKNHGFNLPPGNQGEIDGPHSVKVTFDYDGQSNLTLCIVHRGILVSADKVWEVLGNALKPYLV